MSKTQEAVENEEQSVLISGMKKRLKEKIQICTSLQEKLRDVESKYVFLIFLFMLERESRDFSKCLIKSFNLIILIIHYQYFERERERDRESICVIC